jgi:bifunctional non-homologous end joining protein LigD
MLTLASAPPMTLDERPIDLEAPGWLYELKFDGYRLMAEFGAGACALKSRNGADATRWFPELVAGLEEVSGGPYIVDGEVCVLDDLGRSDFNRLQARARRKRWYEGADPVVYCVFDLLLDRFQDLTALPLLERKRRLDKVLTPRPANVLFVQHVDSGGKALFGHATQLGLEGIVAKRADSTYRPGGRSRDWVKVKRPGAIPAERFKR